MLLGPYSANTVHREFDVICVILKIKWWRCWKMENKQTKTTQTYHRHVLLSLCWNLELENHLFPFCGQLRSPASALSLQVSQPLALMNGAVRQVTPWISSWGNPSDPRGATAQRPCVAGGAGRHGHAGCTPALPRNTVTARQSLGNTMHKEGKKRLYWSLLTNTGLPGRRIASIVMETASALTVVPPWEVNTAWMVVTLNDPLCTLINICLREKHKPARKLISFDTNTVGLFFSKNLLVWSFFKDFL